MSDNKIEINGAEILTNHASWAKGEAAGAADAQTDPDNVEQVDFAGAAE